MHSLLVLALAAPLLAAEPADTVVPEAAAPSDAAPTVEHDFSGADGMMIGYGAAVGAHVGGGVGFAAAPGQGDAVTGGALLGSMAGAGTLWALTGVRHWTPDHVALMSTGSGVGTFAGVQLARTLIVPGAEREYERMVLASVLGNVSGAGIALAAGAGAPPSRSNLLYADVAGVVGWQAAAGALDLATLDVYDDRQIRAPITLASGLGTASIFYALGRRGGSTPPAELLTLSMLNGAWVGAWSPLIFTERGTGQQHAGGMRLGLGAGFVGAHLLAPIVNTGPRSSTLQLVGMAAGNALGAGLPLALGADPEVAPSVVVGPMLAGSVVGQVYGAALTRMYDGADTNAVALGSAMATWTTWQAVGWGLYGSHATDGAFQPTGFALAAGGLGTAVGMGLAPVLQVSASEATMIGAAGGWGTWYGGWTGHLLGVDPEHHWLGTLAFGDVALVGSAVVLAGPADADWTDVALINGLGVAGGAGGALMGIVASPDTNVVAGASLIGSTAGLATGVLMASKQRQAADLAVAGIPVVLDLPVRMAASAYPWQNDDGARGVFVQLDMREK